MSGLLVDTNILLDIVTEDPVWYRVSAELLEVVTVKLPIPVSEFQAPQAQPGRVTIKPRATLHASTISLNLPTRHANIITTPYLSTDSGDCATLTSAKGGIYGGGSHRIEPAAN